MFDLTNSFRGIPITLVLGHQDPGLHTCFHSLRFYTGHIPSDSLGRNLGISVSFKYETGTLVHYYEFTCVNRYQILTESVLGVTNTNDTLTTVEPE